jgi:hypothetical protein
VRTNEIRAQLKSGGGDTSGRHTRTSWSLPIFATFASFALVGVIVASPAQAETVTETVVAPASTETQVFSAGDDYAQAVSRDSYSITDPPPPAPVAPRSSSAPAAGVPDPGSAQAVAYGIVMSMGLGEGEYSCLVSLWNRESGWNTYAHNASSGAYGIPQSLPGEKMASAGADWATNPATQISWGLSYISSRYGTPCGAWSASESKGWY